MKSCLRCVVEESHADAVAFPGPEETSSYLHLSAAAWTSSPHVPSPFTLLLSTELGLPPCRLTLSHRRRRLLRFLSVLSSVSVRPAARSSPYPQAGSGSDQMFSPTRSRKRTKTFTGCWTCRNRKIKCDEAKPCCRQCHRKGLDCEGYTARLQWLAPVTGKRGLHSEDPPGSSISQSLRRFMPAGR